MLQCILSSCLLRRTLCRVVENGQLYVDFFNNGKTCIVLLYELCPLTSSVVFVSSSTYDDV